MTMWKRVGHAARSDLPPFAGWGRAL